MSHLESVSPPTMDASTLAALKDSIAKWKGIVEGTGKDEGAVNCPLCHKFNKWYIGGYVRNDCDGCPVKQHTEQDGCRGSPYEDYENLDEDDGQEELQAAKQAELDFLISLLPKEEKS